jgi:transposase
MRDTDLFQAALGLSSPWRVERSSFDAALKRLDIFLDFARGSRFACSSCGREGCAVHDTREETWRHLDFFQHQAFLRARVPRVTCPGCGVLKVSVPWARSGSGFTLLFEGILMSLIKSMPVRNVAQLVGEHDTKIWRVVHHYVGKAIETIDLSALTQIAIDETSARRGHDYVTLFADFAKRCVVFVAEGKSSEAIDEFVGFLESHDGDRKRISDASIDMSQAFIAGVKANFPNADITFDWFHVMKLVNEAVDEVRRRETRKNVDLKGTRYIWLKNVENLTSEQIETLKNLEGDNLDTVQAYQIRLNLQQIFRKDSLYEASRYLRRWITWVEICDLAPMKKVAKTIMSKAPEILRAIETGLSNGFLEAINARVQAAKRMAKGYRSKRNLKAIIYIVAGDILATLPT